MNTDVTGRRLQVWVPTLGEEWRSGEQPAWWRSIHNDPIVIPVGSCFFCFGNTRNRCLRCG